VKHLLLSADEKFNHKEHGLGHVTHFDILGISVSSGRLQLETSYLVNWYIGYINISRPRPISRRMTNYAPPGERGQCHMT